MTLGSCALALALIADGGFLRAGKDVPVPQQVEHVAPEYPEIARQAVPFVLGIVVLDVGTNELGAVVDIKVMRGAPILAREAVEAAKKWTYAPTVIDGAPKRVAIAEIVEFFPDDSARADYFLDMLKSRKEPPAYRLLALERLKSATGKKLEKLQSLLGKLSKDDGDERVRVAAQNFLQSTAK